MRPYLKKNKKGKLQLEHAGLNSTTRLKNIKRKDRLMKIKLRKNKENRKHKYSEGDDFEFNNFTNPGMNIFNNIKSTKNDVYNTRNKTYTTQKKKDYKIIFSRNDDNQIDLMDSVSEKEDEEEHDFEEDEKFSYLNKRKNYTEVTSIKENLKSMLNNNKNKNKIASQFLNKNIPPWVTEKTKESVGILKLHNEILDFYSFIKTTEEENLIRVKTYKLFTDVIKNKWPNWKLEMFGSFPTDIHLPDSDIDVVVLKETNSNISGNNFNNYVRDSIISDSDQLNAIYLELLKKNFVDEIRFVDAKVPIIKIKVKQTQIRMDISVNRTNGSKAVETFKSIIEKFPFMQPIVILIKFILRQRNLNETFTGGVSSYLLLNMVYAYVLYIQSLEHNNFEQNVNNIGTFFKGFLKFFGEDFDYRELGISVSRGVTFFKKWTRNFTFNENLCFENFQEIDKDIGKGAYQFSTVVEIFREINYKLNKSKIPNDHSYLNLFINITSEIRKRQEKLDNIKKNKIRV